MGDVFLSVALTEKLGQVASHDVFYLSIRQITPHRRAKASKETLINIDFGGANHQKLALHIDRRTKRGKRRSSLVNSPVTRSDWSTANAVFLVDV